MPNSGTKCEEAGDYQANCHEHPNVHKRYKVGDLFTNCPRTMGPDKRGRHSHAVEWILIEDDERDGS